MRRHKLAYWKTQFARRHAWRALDPSGRRRVRGTTWPGQQLDPVLSRSLVWQAVAGFAWPHVLYDARAHSGWNAGVLAVHPTSSVTRRPSGELSRRSYSPQRCIP